VTGNEGASVVLRCIAEIDEGALDSGARSQIDHLVGLGYKRDWLVIDDAGRVYPDPELMREYGYLIERYGEQAVLDSKDKSQGLA
jgi:hypothetical protein